MAAETKQITLAGARVDAGYTQEKMANSLDVSLPTYKAWENYKRQMPADKLSKFSQITGWSMDLIFLDVV